MPSVWEWSHSSHICSTPIKMGQVPLKAVGVHGLGTCLQLVLGKESMHALFFGMLIMNCFIVLQVEKRDCL